MFPSRLSADLAHERQAQLRAERTHHHASQSGAGRAGWLPLRWRPVAAGWHRVRPA